MTGASTPQPLAGIRVLDLSGMGPGPRCARVLSDFGAQITKLLPPADVSSTQSVGARSMYGWYRGFDRLCVDLRSVRGKDVARRLAARADVVIESFRPGVAARLGIGPDDLRADHERLVYCSVTGYGQDGPYAQWPGHDLNWLGVGGFLALSGRDARGVPALPGGVVADALGGMCAANAILGALVRAASTGAGAHLDVAVLEAVLRLTYVSIDEHLATGIAPRSGAGDVLGGSACYGIYRTADDRFVTVAAIEPVFFANLCRALGAPELADAQRDPAAQVGVRNALSARFRTRSRDDWVAELAPLDTCVAPVYEIDEIPDDPHVKARDLVWKAQHTTLGPVEQLVPWLAGAPPTADAAPAVSDLRDTDPAGVLGSIGIDGEALAELLAAGVVS